MVQARSTSSNSLRFYRNSVCTNQLLLLYIVSLIYKSKKNKINNTNINTNTCGCGRSALVPLFSGTF